MTMKKKLILAGVVLSVFFMYGIIRYSYNIGIAKTGNNNNMLNSGTVYAYVPVGAVVYDNIDGKCVDMIASGKKVEIIKDRSKQWYYVKYGNHLGWVKENSLRIPPDSGTEQKQLSVDFIENYADKNFSSKTPHFVWVDIDRQRIYILEKNDGWKLRKIIVCSTGKNQSPTLRGNFTIENRGKWFYSDRLGSGAINWVRYKDSYLFHSVAMDKNKNVIDNTLGQKHSNGCIRMSIENSQWFYDNIEYGTGVCIY